MEEKDEVLECPSEGQGQLAGLEGAPLPTAGRGGRRVWRASPPTRGDPFIPGWSLSLFTYVALPKAETDTGEEEEKAEKGVVVMAVLEIETRNLGCKQALFLSYLGSTRPFLWLCCQGRGCLKGRGDTKEAGQSVTTRDISGRSPTGFRHRKSVLAPHTSDTRLVEELT